MTGKAVTRFVAIMVVALAIAGSLSCGGTPEKAKEPTVGVSASKVREVAQKVKSGEIDVGTEHGMALNDRYHKIHATELGMECADCHLSKPDTEQTVFSAQDVSPLSPGPADRQVCLQCHQDGEASDLYGSDES